MYTRRTDFAGAANAIFTGNVLHAPALAGLELVRNAPTPVTVRSATAVAVLHPAGASSTLDDSFTPLAAYRSPEMIRSPAGCPSGVWVKSTIAGFAGAAGDFPPCCGGGGAGAALVLPAGAVDTPGTTGGTTGGCAAAAAASLRFGSACCLALLIRAPASVAAARTPTAAAMPTTRSGPPGIRGFCTNVTVRSAARSGGAVARNVNERRISCPDHGARARTVSVAGAEEVGAICTLRGRNEKPTLRSWSLPASVTAMTVLPSLAIRIV